MCVSVHDTPGMSVFPCIGMHVTNTMLYFRYEFFVIQGQGLQLMLICTILTYVSDFFTVLKSVNNNNNS